MRARRSLYALCLALLGLRARADDAPAVPPDVLRDWERVRHNASPRPVVAPPTRPLERMRLANGLQVVLAPDDRDVRVRVVVSWNVGDGDGAPGQLQAAHAAEHLLFRATPGLEAPGTAFAEIAAGTGGGTTYSDRTLYETEVQPEHLERLLWLESVRMARAAQYIRADALARERPILRHEFALTTERYPFLRGLAMRAALPETHRSFASPRVLAAIDVLDHDAVLGLVRARYVPGNARLTVVGRFDPAAVRALITRDFAPIAAHPTPQRPREDGPLVFAVGHLRARTVHPSRVVFAWPGVDVDDCQNINLRVLTAALRGSIRRNPVFGTPDPDAPRWSLEPVRQGAHVALVFEALVDACTHDATARAMEAVVGDSLGSLALSHTVDATWIRALDASLAEASRDLTTRAARIAELPSVEDPGGFRCARSAARVMDVTTLRELAGRVFAAPRLRIDMHHDPTVMGLQLDGVAP